MKPTRSCLLALTLCLSSLPAFAQQPPQVPAPNAVPLKLRVEHTTVLVGQAPQMMLLPARCDGRGNYYVRFFSGSKPEKSPVRAFKQDGVQTAVFALVGLEFDRPGFGAIDFAVTKDGRVYVLADGEGGSYIVEFNPDGTMKSKVQLAVDFNALHFGAFESGKFLVVGVDRETPTNLDPHSPYTAVFGKDGSIIAKVVFPEDKQYEAAANRGDPDFFDSQRIGGGNFAVENGTVVQSSDGNVFVVRWTRPTRVYAVSDMGQVIRAFEVDSGLGDRKPSAVHESAGKLAIQFAAERADPRSLLKVVSSNGEELATYDAQGAGVAFACYSAPERFTFFTAGPDNLQLTSMDGPHRP